MRKYFTIVIIIILLIPSVYGAYDVDYYYSAIEAVRIDKNVNFDINDLSDQYEYSNHTLIYRSTSVKQIWIGSLPLNRGEPTNIDSINFDPNFNGTVSFRINEFPDIDANISIFANVIKLNSNSTTKLTLNLLNVKVSEGDQLKYGFNKKIGFSYLQIAEGRYLDEFSYFYFIEYEPESYFFSSISAKIILNGNETWRYNADFNVIINIYHNPIFDNLMKKRFNPINTSEKLFYEKYRDIILSGILFILTLIITYRRKKIKSQKQVLQAAP